MYEYHENYIKAKGDADAQGKECSEFTKTYSCGRFTGRWARQLTWEIARHAVGEEIVVYPLMEKLLGEKGLQLADHDREEHQVRSHLVVRRSLCTHISNQTVKEQLSHLESLTPGTAEYDSTITSIMEHLHKHNDEEETKDLPLLEPKLGIEKSREEAKVFSRTKKFVPTRSAFLSFSGRKTVKD